MNDIRNFLVYCILYICTYLCDTCHIFKDIIGQVKTLSTNTPSQEPFYFILCHLRGNPVHPFISNCL